MDQLRLKDTEVMRDADVDALRGTFSYGTHYDHVVREDTTVLKPDGSVLLIYKANAITRETCQATFDAFKRLPLPKTDARGMASGGRPFRRQVNGGTVSRT